METLEIKGFRGFKHLTVKRLGRVNLVVGKNNVGKSSLLEALRLYGAQGSPSVLRTLLWSRDELPPDVSRFAFRREPVELTPEQLFRMFYLHYNPTHTPEPIEIGPIRAPDESLKIRLEWFSSSPGEDGRLDWNPVQLTPDAPWSCRPAWLTESRHRRPRPIFLDQLASSRLVWDRFNQKRSSQYVSAHGFDSLQLGRLYDQVAVQEGIGDVLFALRLIAPDVEEILLVAEGRSRQVLLRVRDAKEPVPLGSLGDGMNRVLGIILALVNSRGDLLLIDEIENGIHYSVMPGLWQLIFRLAAELNVQVFATTHSWDCIEGFQKAATADTENEGVLIRLERRRGEIEATVFDEDELATATRENIEVR